MAAIQTFGGSSMPPFIAAALALLGRTFLGTPARAALTGITAGTLVPGGGFDIPGIDLFPGGRQRRRRRRRALTASDRADIGFITGLLGKPAGKEFAIVISTR